jgi:hypothetical protein
MFRRRLCGSTLPTPLGSLNRSGREGLCNAVSKAKKGKKERWNDGTMDGTMTGRGSRAFNRVSTGSMKIEIANWGVRVWRMVCSVCVGCIWKVIFSYCYYTRRCMYTKLNKPDGAHPSTKDPAAVRATRASPPPPELNQPTRQQTTPPQKETEEQDHFVFAAPAKCRQNPSFQILLHPFAILGIRNSWFPAHDPEDTTPP